MSSGVYNMRVAVSLQRAQRDRDLAVTQPRQIERARKHLREVDLGRARNAIDCCAKCGEPIDARRLLAWDGDLVVSHVGCA
jgi:RNA polymerase-binding transcription factor DksA